MRLTRITTRTGDDGSTGLADGSRVPKDHPRIEALGAVDELNAALAMILAEIPGNAPTPDTLDTPHPPMDDGHRDLRAALVEAQHRLFDVGAGLALPGQRPFDARATLALEAAIESFNARLPPLADFILPGGDRAAAACHLARTIARRAERRLVTLAHAEAVDPEALRYLNRLSDLLFVLARTLTRSGDRPETLWKPART